ncbi:MAG TPA: DUF2381 family protein, partial [Myxococcaceae bacterium]|nr:DUF2381 family protein [Myxococcaceae bacterium]
MLAIAASANAQPECLHRWKAWEPQRTGLFFSKDQPDQPVQTVHVAGEVATNLMLPSEVDPSQTKLVGGDGRFEPLMISGRSVVIVPLRDLAFDESFSVLVKLKDGTAMPFSLRAPRHHESTDGQVDVYLNQEDTLAVRRALQLARLRVEELVAENERHVQEELSVDHALAALLARDKSELTPFTMAGYKLLQGGDVELKVFTFRPRNRKANLGKAAVAFSVKNKDPKKPWELEEVRLMSATTGDMKAFASRASSPSIGPGETGMVAVVMNLDVFGSGVESDHLILELWRAGPVARQASVELV